MLVRGGRRPLRDTRKLWNQTLEAKQGYGVVNDKL